MSNKHNTMFRFKYCSNLQLLLSWHYCEYFKLTHIIYRIGRKMALMAMIALQSGSAIGVAFTESFVAYVILRFITGVSISGLFLAVFVLGEYFTIQVSK